jgi:hypothetical protein
MNAEQLQQYTKLPLAQSTRLVDFDKAEIVTLPIFPPRYVLRVTGVRPWANMEVDLVPLVYIRQPDYWGIEVIGRSEHRLRVALSAEPCRIVPKPCAHQHDRAISQFRNNMCLSPCVPSRDHRVCL